MNLFPKSSVIQIIAFLNDLLSLGLSTKFFDDLKPVKTNKELFRILAAKEFQMTIAEKNIVDAYSRMFEGLSDISKIELLALLTRSLKREKISGEKDFYRSFGGFGSDKSAEELITEIKGSRKFRNRDFKI